jgi:alkaline phosphatase D
MILKNKKTKVIGVWDDHDSGINDSDKNNIYKEEVKQLWLDFIDEPKNSERRSPGRGIYTSYFLDQAKTIKVYLLDVRYERDPYFNKYVDKLG